MSRTGSSNVIPLRRRTLVVSDARSQLLLEQVEQVAPSDAAVLLLGPTGTGKELIARQLHKLSGRRGEFIALNCGALPESLAESELFGHEAGAFSGASARQTGWFEAANGGTLFLDEVGTLSEALQVKLLRVLQEREVVRLGSRQPVALDLRLVSATHDNLAAAVAAGRFRRDLYYRLAVVTVHVPALGDRPGDILPLASHFLQLHGRGRGPLRLTRDAERLLLQHAWPGNVRELENAMIAAALSARDGLVRAQDLKLRHPAPRAATTATQDADPFELIAAQIDALLEDDRQTGLLARLERLLVERGFEHAGGNQLQTARRLGVSRNAVRTLLKRHGLLP